MDKHMKKYNLKTINGSKPNEFKGLACVRLDKSVINLGNNYWRLLGVCLQEDKLIEEIVKTAVHEEVHLEIGTWGFTPDNYTNEGEERVCELLAGQTDLRHTPDTNRKI